MTRDFHAEARKQRQDMRDYFTRLWAVSQIPTEDATYQGRSITSIFEQLDREDRNAEMNK